MVPSLLITFREVIEASLIVATILGILTRLNRKQEIKTVWAATLAASAASILLLATGSLFGLKMQEIYSGRTEEFIEGILMITSAIFITWAVFFLHNQFGRYKTKLLSSIKKTVDEHHRHGLFVLVFTAVFREGFEIVLFLSTIFFSSNPIQIFSGFSAGIILGLFVCALFFRATLRMPIFYAFRTTSVLLILFAAGLLARGIHEFAEVGLIPELSRITFAFIPDKTTFTGGMIKIMFGITRHMDYLQLSFYLTYVYLMHRRVFVTYSNTSKKVT